jgi:hypothetical protein
MKIFVAFEFPDITDPDGPQADEIIDWISIDLKTLAEDIDCDWYIDDVTE